MLARWMVIDQNFSKKVKAGDLPRARVSIQPNTVGLSDTRLLDLFDSQLKSRHLDLFARVLKEKEQGFYTIGSSGHEGNAVLGLVFRHTDMAFLHYRSAALFIQRAKQLSSIDPIHDLLLSFTTAAADPCCSGRHKVFGSKALNIPPQTSTIASHLPKAVGAAFSISRAKKLHINSHLPSDAVILCNFGDASLNHASAQAALNTASWIAHAHYPLPIVFICEDNGIGVSVPTPDDWVANNILGRKDIEYMTADALNLADTYRATKNAQEVARNQHRPVFLHLRTVRLMGHAGSDIESHYWSEQEIIDNEAQDPLLHTARMLIENEILSADEIIKYYERVRAQVKQKAEAVIELPKLTDAKAVMNSILPSQWQPSPDYPEQQLREKIIPTKERTKAKTMAQCLNMAFHDSLLRYHSCVFLGEDVGRKGGVYRLTAGLQKEFGARRVFDTLLDETTILATAQGMALNGFMPVPEIQFLAFLHNAIDQIRGEAATLSFFSNGQFTNPMLVRVPGLAYQKGFGGHYHNDNAVGFLREIPGVTLICPSRADNAVKLWRTAMKLSYEQQRVVIFLEPIALYHAKDLHKKGDQQWLCQYPELTQEAAVGEVQVDNPEQLQTAIITYGNGYYLCKKVEPKIEQAFGVKPKIIDLQWLAPLPMASLKKALQGVHNILIVDECRRTGSVSEEIVTWLVEEQSPLPNIKRITGEDCFIPLGETWQYLLPSEQTILDAYGQLMSGALEMERGVL